MRLVYVLLFCLALGQVTRAQSFKIESMSTSCLGAETSITYSTTAVIAGDNQFSVEVRGYYNPNSTQTFPATVKNGKLTVVFQNLIFPDYILRSLFQARIISTKPVAQSDWSGEFFLNRPAKATLTGATTQAVNPSEPAGLQFVYEGTYPLSVTLSDSSKFALNTNSFDLAGTVTQAIVPKATTTFRLVQVSNVCGIGQSSGSATVQVNPIGVRTTGVSVPQLCLGSDLRVSYSAQPAAFMAANQFKIRLTSYNTNTNREDPSLTYDLDAVLENGALRTTIPTTIPTQTGYTGLSYTVRVLSTAPAALGDYAGYRVEIRPVPTTEFTAGSRTIKIGESVDLGLKFAGLAPFSAVLSDGTLVRQDFSYDGPTQAPVRPRQTTKYTVSTLQSGCGPVPVKTSGSVVISVDPGIALDSVTTAPICEGQSQRIRFSHNLALGGSNQFFVRIRYNNTWTSDPIPAQQQGNYLVFAVPMLQLPPNSDYRTQAFSMQISSTQPAVSSEWRTGLSFFTYPAMKWAVSNTYTIDRAQQRVAWYWTGAGGGGYQIEMETGETSGNLNVYDNGATVSLPGIESKTFRVKTIKNACYTTANPAQATLTVRSNEGRFIYVRPYKTTVCRGDSMEISFQAFGAFEPDNQFRVQTRGGSSCCSFPDTWASTAKDGIIKVKVPTDFGWYSSGGSEVTFRLASTNPVVFSDELPLAIHRPPYDVRFTEKSDVLLLKPGTAGGTLNYLGGTPVTINYSVGSTDYSLTTSSIYSTSISYSVPANTTFVLKSVTNACGLVTAGQTASYRIVPYTLQLTPYNGNSYEVPNYCAGSTLTVPYQMVGQPDPAGSVSLQWREAKATTFRTLVTNSRANPVVLALPDTLLAGDYVFRLVSNLNITSGEQTIRIRRKATAQLTTESVASTVEAVGNTSSALKVELTGAPDWTVVFSDGQRQTYSSSPGLRYIMPITKTTYSIQTLTNACGYGTTTGMVTASVKPTLSLSTTGYFFCTGAKIPVVYAAQGEFGPDNQLKIGLTDSPGSSTVRWLDSTAVARGNLLLSLPGSLTPGTYYLRMTSTNPAQTITTSFQLATTPVVTLGGSAVVNPQQSATIRLIFGHPASDGNPVRYTLSTGATGTYTYFSGPIDLVVQPAQTTTYRLTSVSNNCGAGQGLGSATITVNPLTDNQITTRDAQLRTGATGLCASDTILVPFDSKGAFSAANRFTVQLSDSTGGRFTDITTFGVVSPLRALVPTGLPRSNFYRVRVTASDNGVSSASNPTPLAMRYSATAAFESASVVFEPGKSTKLRINLTGDAPWSVQIGNEFNPVSVLNAFSSPYVIDLTPTAASTTYKLYRVSNGCGVGKLADPFVTQVGVLTATEPIAFPFFSVYPNPTTGRLQVRRSGPGQPYQLELMDLNGRVLLRKSVTGESSEHDLSLLPGGVYLMRLEAGEHSATYRVFRQ